MRALDLSGPLRKNASCRMPEKCSSKHKPSTRKETRELEIRISFLEGLVRRDPNYVEAFQLLGDNYTQHGDYLRSLEVDEKLSQLQPKNPLVFYNLACSHALNGQLDAAASSLAKALRLGYRDFKWLAKDPDLLPLRQHPLYRSIESQIRKMKVEIA